MKSNRQRRGWTDAERRLMEAEFPCGYTVHLAEKLGRSYQSVSNMAHLMGLKKNESFKTMERQRQGERIVKAGSVFRFKKGQVSHKKGVPLTPELYAKLAHTMFKKGQAPINETWDGYERLTKDGYIEVRVKRGVFVSKHRLVWEAANGPVPKGHKVVFKDGNPMNLQPDNLQLVSNAEHMLRNSRHGYTPELIPTVLAISKLRKKVKELTINN